MSTSELWRPGIDLQDEYPVPSEAELVELWSDYVGETAQPTDGVYGAYRVPEESVRAVASIDVCEVLRDTAVAFDHAIGQLPARRSDYALGNWLARHESDYRNNVYTSVLRPLMQTGLVPPVENIDDITAILHGWRERGIYRVANTSTLPGCEQGTIRYSLGRDVPGGFDAILFPRNHDGLGLLTKAGALALHANQIDLNLADKPVVHIDDAAHHIQAFADSRDRFPVLNLVVPVNTSNAGTHPDYEAPDPLQAFERADDYFKRQGI